LAKLRGKSSSGEEVDLNPHRSAPSGFIGSLFRLIYLWCDYSIGYWVKLRLSLAKNPTVILFDRYAYDLAMDPARFRINLPVWLINAFVWLLPRPDLSICLYAPIDEVLKRKQELPREELERQTAFLRAYADRHSDAVLVSTDSSVDRVRDKVLSTISERLSCG
jgi:thymidylate kinase